MNLAIGEFAKTQEIMQKNEKMKKKTRNESKLSWHSRKLDEKRQEVF